MTTSTRAPHVRGVVALVVLAVLGAACGDPAQSASPPGSIVELGPIDLVNLPEELSGGSIPAPPTLAPSVEPTVPTTALPGTDLEPGADPITPGTVGELVDGNQVVLIGDSILASTAPRYGGVMCDVLGQFGWSAEIDARTGQHIEYGEQVLDFRDGADAPDFDVAVVMLGNNFRGDYNAFTDEYDELLDRLAPRPTVIFTLTEDDAVKARINEFLEWRSYFHPNVIVVDWAKYTADEPAKLLSGDGLHLTNEGRGRLALFTVAALGEAPASIRRPVCTDNSDNS